VCIKPYKYSKFYQGCAYVELKYNTVISTRICLKYQFTNIFYNSTHPPWHKHLPDTQGYSLPMKMTKENTDVC
jgi:hypothetical protein